MVKQEDRRQIHQIWHPILVAQQGTHLGLPVQVVVQTGITTGVGVPAQEQDGVMAQAQAARPMGLAGVLALALVRALVQAVDMAMVLVEVVPLGVDMDMELEVVLVVLAVVVQVSLRVARHPSLGKGTAMVKEIVLEPTVCVSTGI